MQEQGHKDTSKELALDVENPQQINSKTKISGKSPKRMQNQIHQETEDPKFIKLEEVYKKIKKNETHYYLPCYVRLLVKEISNINVAEMQAEVVGTLIFTFYYGNLE